MRQVYYYYLPIIQTNRQMNRLIDFFLNIIETTSGKPQLVPGTMAERRASVTQTPPERESEPPVDAANQ